MAMQERVARRSSKSAHRDSIPFGEYAVLVEGKLGIKLDQDRLLDEIGEVGGQIRIRGITIHVRRGDDEFLSNVAGRASELSEVEGKSVRVEIEGETCILTITPPRKGGASPSGIVFGFVSPEGFIPPVEWISEKEIEQRNPALLKEIRQNAAIRRKIGNGELFFHVPAIRQLVFDLIGRESQLISHDAEVDVFERQEEDFEGIEMEEEETPEPVPRKPHKGPIEKGSAEGIALEEQRIEERRKRVKAACGEHGVIPVAQAAKMTEIDGETLRSFAEQHPEVAMEIEGGWCLKTDFVTTLQERIRAKKAQQAPPEAAPPEEESEKAATKKKKPQEMEEKMDYAAKHIPLSGGDTQAQFNKIMNGFEEEVRNRALWVCENLNLQREEGKGKPKARASKKKASEEESEGESLEDEYTKKLEKEPIQTLRESILFNMVVVAKKTPEAVSDSWVSFTRIQDTMKMRKRGKSLQLARFLPLKLCFGVE